MITTTLDPISLSDVTDIENAPWVIEGEGDNALKIYFESEANRREYLNIPGQSPGDNASMKAIHHDMADNPNSGSSN